MQCSAVQMPAFKLNPQLFNPGLYRRLLVLWFKDVPAEAAVATPAVQSRWFGRGSAAERAAFDGQCQSSFRAALDSVGPTAWPLPHALDAAEATKDAAERDEQLAAPFLAAAGDSAERALALVLLLDQVARNVFRDRVGQRLVFAHYDVLARAFVRCLLLHRPSEQQQQRPRPDQAASYRGRPVWRAWFYMPLMHSEVAADHHLFATLAREMRAHANPDGPDSPDSPDTTPAVQYVDQLLAFEERHAAIVRTFGRYPYRNPALGRPSTAEEQAWLAAGGDTFGVSAQ